MHAYMIIAHNQFELLEKLITALDDVRNDIYVHIDAKAKDFDFERFSALTKHSRVLFTNERVNVTWGDYSVVKAEMTILKKAVENEPYANAYSYFHLISGVDFPIKSNDEIHAFLETQQDREFVHFTDDTDSTVAENRVRYYHFFRSKRNTFTKILSQILLRIQKLIGVNRLKKSGLQVQKGCNWFSITGAFAHYVYERLEEYDKVLHFCYCGDEVFIQTALINSPFKDNLFMPHCGNNHVACLRLIDWKRGNPYVWTSADYDEIIASDCIFARKFDWNKDKQIVEKLLYRIKQ